jgi:carboxyl-terminal processing protease
MRRNDTGRLVYGGGGIEPDIKIESPLPTNVQNVIWTSGLFLFVRELMTGRIASAPHFKSTMTEFDHEPRAGEFEITDQIVQAYREFMADFISQNEEIGLTMKMVDENLDWSRKKIREEVLIAAYGIDTQKRMMMDSDAQLQRSILELPQSAQLAERARRVVRASKK